MNVVILTSVRLLGDGLVSCLKQHDDINFLSIESNIAALKQAMPQEHVDLVLVDVTQGINIEEVRLFAAENPNICLIAFGLEEQRQEVIRCGRAGFSGYVARDASIETLCKAINDVIAGRLACPAEISGGLLRALFRMDSSDHQAQTDESLTRREEDVLHLIARGLSNKEIARELNLSIATVKHHVHHILGKFNLPTRTQVMRKVRENPWIGWSSVAQDRGKPN